ncbi:hypothetical protein CPB83DRAFT_860575 [Crepidotus variabilis]|uniref:Methyltransferase domain-containing protein n=1 Tax=Crepidotus variabilis TaxID=179855 RepID=A0A9P6E9D4_9AGAR|nr:hypothetical protein CPB83DRAFT_860575 [Crepidotus variabilis]
MSSTNELKGVASSLDPSIYSLEGEELAFVQKLTGISDEEELKNHIISVQTKAYAVYGYPCIRAFAFLRMRMFRSHAYQVAFKLREVRENPILLDIGCCFGNDVRKAVDDGWPVEDIVASDLRQEFWDAGHELFKSSPETFPAAFVPGDAFDDLFLAPNNLEDLKSLVDGTPNSSSVDRPNLRELKSLNPLRGKLSVVHASSFFHLFEEEKQRNLAWRLAALLIPKPGSVIFGRHIATPEVGIRRFARRGQSREMFCHSPLSWKQLWGKEIFGAAGIKAIVTAHLIDISEYRKDIEEEEKPIWLMKWSVVLA